LKYEFIQIENQKRHCCFGLHLQGLGPFGPRAEGHRAVESPAVPMARWPILAHQWQTVWQGGAGEDARQRGSPIWGQRQQLAHRGRRAAVMNSAAEMKTEMTRTRGRRRRRSSRQGTTVAWVPSRSCDGAGGRRVG
jgi:hypothetical protein